MTTKLRFAIVFAAAAFALGSFLAYRDVPWSSVPRPESAVTPEQATTKKLLPASTASIRRPPSLPQAVVASTRRQALDMYREWSKFPPNSRPLREEQTDIADPLIVLAGSRRLFRQTATGRVEPSEHECSLQPLTHVLTEGKEELIQLSCAKARPDPTAMPSEEPPVPLDITSVTVTGRTPSRTWQVPAGAVSWNDTGEAGDEKAADGVYTIRVQNDAADWGDMDVRVSFHVPGEVTRGSDTTRPYDVAASYFSSPRAPARFLGEFQERLEGGSLVIEALLDVQKPGRYRVYGNLKHGDQLIGYAQEEMHLAAGRQRVPLLFFGKLFHDARAEGSFTLVDVRGYRANRSEDSDRPTEPDREQIPPAPAAYQTRTYPLADFSASEWQSPRKSERLRELEELATAD